jgi:hypothetical protein
MSRVFLAEEVRLGRQVVLKLLPADRYPRFDELWKDADSELQPGVREVRERLARLATETPS